jgi:hypothetical protein
MWLVPLLVFMNHKNQLEQMANGAYSLHVCSHGREAGAAGSPHIRWLIVAVGATGPPMSRQVQEWLLRVVAASDGNASSPTAEGQEHSF